MDGNWGRGDADRAANLFHIVTAFHECQSGLAGEGVGQAQLGEDEHA